MFASVCPELLADDIKISSQLVVPDVGTGHKGAFVEESDAVIDTVPDVENPGMPSQSVVLKVVVPKRR